MTDPISRPAAPGAPGTPCTPGTIVWIISTGTEILQGLYPDRNGPWLSERLLGLGLATARHMALPDDLDLLRQGLAEAARKADLVITTGGLGPTSDDLNRQVIAETWDAPLAENAEAWERIVERFRHRGRPVVPGNRVQALVPRGCLILQNEHGTAPGFYLRPGKGSPARATILALPGPPREMQPMFLNQAAPLIREQFCQGRPPRRVVAFHTMGLPESLVDQNVKDLYDRDPRVTVTLLAGNWHVDVRFTFAAGDDAANEALDLEWRELLYARIDRRSIFGENGETIEQVIGRLLRARGETLAVAESCTGGLLAGRITDVAGSSDYFREGWVTYANEAKTALLGVPAELIAARGAVSAEVAEAMASGARRAAGSDWAIAVTGIAGPGGGTPEKPVGLVYFALATPAGDVRVMHARLLGQRPDVRYQAVQTALEMLRRAMME